MSYSVSELHNPTVMKTMAESLEEYLYILDDYIIVNGITEKEYNEAVSVVKKLIKKLKKGDTSVYVSNLDEVVDDLNSEQYPFDV